MPGLYEVGSETSKARFSSGAGQPNYERKKIMATERAQKILDRMNKQKKSVDISGIDPKTINAIKSMDQAKKPEPDYMDEAHKYKARHNCSLFDAMRAANRSNPALRVQFIKKHNPHHAQEGLQENYNAGSNFEDKNEAVKLFGPGHDFLAMMEEHKRIYGCSGSEAHRAIAKKYPDTLERCIAQANEGR
jgi:hypothetical protein